MQLTGILGMACIMKQEIILIALAIPFPVAVNKTISFSSSLTHVVVDKGAAPSDQGCWKVLWGLQPLPSPGPWGTASPGCCWGWDWSLCFQLSSPSSVCTDPAPLLCNCFHLQEFQCSVCGNHFRIGEGKSTELGELWEPSSLWIISGLKYLCEVWRVFFFFPWAGSCPVKGFS